MRPVSYQSPAPAETNAASGRPPGPHLSPFNVHQSTLTCDWENKHSLHPAQQQQAGGVRAGGAPVPASPPRWGPSVRRACPSRRPAPCPVPNKVQEACAQQVSHPEDWCPGHSSGQLEPALADQCHLLNRLGAGRPGLRGSHQLHSEHSQPRDPVPSTLGVGKLRHLRAASVLDLGPCRMFAGQTIPSEGLAPGGH